MPVTQCSTSYEFPRGKNTPHGRSNAIPAQHSFHAIPDSLKWVANHERTRWFLVLHVTQPAGDGLNRLLELSNRALAQYNQPPLYAALRKVRQSRTSMASTRGDVQPVADFSDFFHISLAWSLVEPSAADAQRVADIDLGPVCGLRVQFDSVKAKIGNQVESIRLPVDI